MLKASEAREISNGYNAEAANRMKAEIEKGISDRAKIGYFWSCYDYGRFMANNDITRHEVYRVINELRNLGYGVKDEWGINSITIRW